MISKGSDVGSIQYPTYAAALGECRGGYAASELVDSMYARQKAFYHTSTPFPAVPWYLTAGMAAALPLASRGGPLRVLDFGGSVGIHYLLATKCYPNISIGKWAVVETPEFVSKAYELATSTLRFFDEIEKAMQWLGGVEIVTTTGALQYTPDPFLYLQRLLDLEAPVFATQRCALSLDDNGFITIQKSMLSNNARGATPEGFSDREVRYPITFCSEHETLALLLRLYDSNIRILNENEALECGRRTRSGDAIVCWGRRGA